jgi:hypothetical protein
MKTNVERVLDYLWSVSPNGATNAEIRVATGIQPHQQVYMITSELVRREKIRRRKTGREWVFYLGETTEEVLSSPGKAHPGTTTPRLSAAQFEEVARRVFSQYFGVPLNEGQVPGVPKLFDFVSPDGSIVGDAKYFTLVGGHRLPPAKFSIIAEHVWLLEKTGANHKFLVFGNDREVPVRWLARYSALVSSVRFFFMDDGGEIALISG